MIKSEFSSSLVTQASGNKMFYEGDQSLNLVMEKLRLKNSQYKTWNETAKLMRSALMDKRQFIDSSEREILLRCLDSLQKSIKVTTLQSMVERLESMTRQQGLTLTSGPSGTDCFISSDMFYVEVLLELNGDVKDVKIAHQADNDLMSCPLLAEILRKGDFKEFTNHLEGLVSIYQLNADKKQKSKAYLALKALETDLNTLSELQSSINEPNNLVHRSPVGILQERIGGKSMKLTYFISPYDLLDLETKQSIPLTVEIVKSKGLGHSVTVGIESSSAHKLQTTSLMTISKADGKSLPQFAALSNLNSTTLPACFALHLPKPTPMCINLIKKIQAVTGISCADISKSQPMLKLISQQVSNGQVECNSNKGMFVTLPDQHHCYFLNSGSEMNGVLVTSIPFVHPTHVPQILVFLRQQTMFNELISSCIRPNSKADLENAHTFEVTALSWLHVSISFEHPSDESMATADLDLSDVTSCKCKLYSLSSENSICSDEYASKVLQRCLSIPIMMRSILKKAQALQAKSTIHDTDPFYNAVSAGMNSSTRQRFFGGPNGASDAINGKFGFNGDGKSYGKTGEEMDYLCQSVDTSPQVNNSSTMQNPSNSDILTSSSSVVMNSQSSVITSESTLSESIQLPTPNLEQKGSGMLMNMLNDTAQNQPVTMLLPKIRKQRKRKNNENVVNKNSIGKSPKRKFSEEDLREMRTPTPSSTPDNLSSGSTSPAGPYDANVSFFPIKSSPSTESSSSHSTRLTSPLESQIKKEPLEQSPIKPQVDSNCDSSVKASDNHSSPDVSNNQSSKDQYEFTPADCVEPHLSGYRTENSSVESDSTASHSSRSSEKVKEKKSKKIKSEPVESRSSIFDIQCSVAEQVAKLHGDPMSPPSLQSSSSTAAGSTSIKISTKDGIKISSKIDVKKHGKRSSSAGTDADSSRKSDLKKEKRPKRAESADALEHKASIKLLPLPSGTRVSQVGEKKSGDSRLSSHGNKSSTSTSGSGSSQSKVSITSFKKSPHSSSTTPTKNVSILKHSQSTKNKLSSKSPSSSKLSMAASEILGKSASNKSLKFHSIKSEKSNSEKLKLKQLNFLTSTTITPIGTSKSSSSSSTHTVTIVPSPSDTSKGQCLSIMTPPSMSITPVVSSSPSPSGGSKTFPSNSSSTTPPKSNSSSNGSNKSPSKPRKGSLSAVIDKLMVNASVTQPPGDLSKSYPDKKGDKKEFNNSTESRKYNIESKNTDNKAEFTVKQSSQGIKLTVTKTKTTSDNKVNKVKTSNKSSLWSSETPGSSTKVSSSKLPMSVSSVQVSSKKHSSGTNTSSKMVPKSSSTSLKITVNPNSSVKVASSKLSNSKSIGENKLMIDKDSLKAKVEEKATPKGDSKPDTIEKMDVEVNKHAESDSEKMFQRLISEGRHNDGNSFMSNEKTAANKTSNISQSTNEAIDYSSLSSHRQNEELRSDVMKKIVESVKSDDDDEEELVIDCPGTPRKQRVSFEEKVCDGGFNPQDTSQDAKSIAESKVSPPQPSPMAQVKSPVNVSTPHSEILSNPSSVSRPSPCIIDDDLMDEALMLRN